MNYNKNPNEFTWKVINCSGWGTERKYCSGFLVKKKSDQNIPLSFFMFCCFHSGMLAKSSLVIPNTWLKSESDRCF